MKEIVKEQIGTYDLPTLNALWTDVQAVQSKAKTRTLNREDVNNFLQLWRASLLFCEKYRIKKGVITVFIDGGTVNYSCGYRAENTKIEYSTSSQRLKVQRANCLAVVGGRVGLALSRIVFLNCDRQGLLEDGWDLGRDYVYLYHKDTLRLIPQPKEGDVVLGGTSQQPRPYDAVLGSSHRN